MSTLRFKRFTRPPFLRQIGRHLIARLFGQFADDLAAHEVRLPSEDLADYRYFDQLANLMMSPQGLPENLIETLYAIEEMSNAQGQERLETAVEAAGLDLKLDPNSSPGDVAVQVWLARPDLLTEQHSRMRLSRLATFEYYASPEPMGRSAAFTPPDPAVLDLLASDMDIWFEAHSRGRQTTSIEVYPLAGEFWFLIRHGDTYTRTAKVEQRQTHMLHFRPARDDVVVYSPALDEIRIHAGTKGERNMYRRAFGRRLRQNANHFSHHLTYTLDPLRLDGPDVLDTSDIDGLRQVVLREVEVAYDNEYSEVLIRKARDVFAALAGEQRLVIPAQARPIRAVFDCYFETSRKPRKVHLKPPNTLRLGRHCDAGLIQPWLSARQFRRTAGVTPNREDAGVKPLVRS